MPEQNTVTSVFATAPGKLVLAGEYAVLDGAPALCMALDRRARASIGAGTDDYCTISAPGFSDVTGRFRVRNGNCEWLAGREEFRLVEDVWRTAEAAGDIPLSLELDTTAFLDRESGNKIGIGSSAALTVALAAALCATVATSADATRIAFAAHRQFQGGFGSGADVACCSTGGIIEYRMGSAPAATRAWPDGLAYALLWSGVAASTGAKLRQLHKLDLRPTRAALADAATRVAASWRDGDAETIVSEFRDYTNALREFSVDHDLGIFDAGHAELVVAAEDAGLVYKPCGAGGGDIGIVVAADADAIRAFVSNEIPEDFRVMNMSIDSCGVQVVREDN